ncbi:MAG: ParB N-terminal domain-containing protein [Caulobacter sp.]|nr:ParB N-terminal domain-containing protein [Caulobacter sp.]
MPAARMRLPAEQVVVGERLRPLSPAKVEALIVSFHEAGALPPILTRPVDLEGDLPVVALVAGLHRLEACRQMGVPVDCMVREMSDAVAQLTEIDENLLGPDLNALDRAVFIAARLPVWAAMNPDRVEDDQKPKRGRPKNSAKFAHFPTGMGFTEETAVEIGLSRRSVEYALQVARGLTPATRAALAGTWVARNEGVLRQLAGVAEPDEQIAVAGELVSGRTKSVSEARAYAAGREPIKPAKTGVDEALKALEKLWKGAPRPHREAMLHWLAGQAMPAGWVVKGGRG